MNETNNFTSVHFDPPHTPDQSTLRPYQKECIDKIDACKEGSHLVVLPTGCGKTYVFSHIPRRGRVLILSHRDELVHQPEKYYDCSFGVEQAEEHSNGEEVVSASVQSLIRRLDKFHPEEFDMIITDEAHHATAPSYQKIYDYFKPRIHIGFTATPDRADKADLHKIYNDIIYMKDMKWGIKEGFLTDIDCYQVDVGYNLIGVKKQMGDYAINGLSDAMMKTECVDAVVDAYNQYRKGQTMIFAVNVAHAYELAKKIPGAKVVVGDTPNRDKIIESFVKKEFPCIVSVMIFSEGTDIPLIETVIMVRPTQNQSLYTQMVGRGLRPYPGKESLTLIDCVGVTKQPPINVGHLFGLNMEIVPKKKREQLQGVKITEMEDKIEIILDGPDSWINGAKRVALFSQDNDVDLRDVNFVPMGDNSLHLSLGNRREITIFRSDALGETTAILTEFVDFNNPKAIKEIFEKAPLQDVIDSVYNYLLQKEVDSRALWDARLVSYWGNAPASDSQKDYIRLLFTQTGRDIGDININTLTKQQAGILIDRLKTEPKKYETKKTNTATKPKPTGLRSVYSPKYTGGGGSGWY